MRGSNLKHQLHTFVGGGKAQPAIKSMGVGAHLIGRQLRRSAPSLPCQAKGIFYQGLTKPAAAAGCTDPNRFDLGPPSTLVTEAGNKGQLQAGDNSGGILSHDQRLARIGRDGGKGVAIRLGQRVAQVFAGCAQLVVGQKRDNGRKIRDKGGAKLDRLCHGAGLLRTIRKLLPLYKLEARICPEKVSYAYP